MSLDTIKTGIGTLDKNIREIETVGLDIGPLVQQEVNDGHAAWAMLMKTWENFKEALATVRMKTQSTPPPLVGYYGHLQQGGYNQQGFPLHPQGPSPVVDRVNDRTPDVSPTPVPERNPDGSPYVRNRDVPPTSPHVK